MKTIRSEQYAITYKGNDYDVSVTRREIGKKDEIDVTASSPTAEPQQSKAVFRVYDEKDRLTRFRDIRPQELGKPKGVHVLGINRFGWYCSNLDYEDVSMHEFDAVLPALGFIDDMLDTIKRGDESPLRDKPFALDLLEIAQTAIAWVNGTYEADKYARNEVGGGTYYDSTGEEVTLADATLNPQNESQTEYAISNAISHGGDDPYLSVVMAPLVNHHFGADLTWREMWEAGDDHPAVLDCHTDVGVGDEVLKKENVRPGSFLSAFAEAAPPEEYFDPPLEAWQDVPEEGVE